MDTRPPNRSELLIEALIADMGGNDAQQQGIDFRAYLQVVLKHKWGILTLSLLAAVVSVFYASTLVPRYQSVVTMLYEPPSTSNYGTVRDLTAMEDYSRFYRDNRLFRAQNIIMQSRQFAEQMVDHFELWNHPFFVQSANPTQRYSFWQTLIADFAPQWMSFLSIEEDDPDGPEGDAATNRALYRNRAINTIRGGMTLTQQEDVMLLRLGFMSSNPDFAAEMANKLAEFYGQYELNQRLQSFERATEWLVDRTQDLRGSLLNSELALQEFKQTEDVGMSGSAGAIAEQQISDVLTNLSAVRKTVQSLTQTVSRMERGNDASLGVDSSELVNYPAVRTALDAEIEAAKAVDELSRVYGPRHPRMIEATNNHARLQERLSREIRLVITGLQSDLDVARANEQRLARDFDRLKAEVQTLDQKSSQLLALERARNTDQELYDLFVTRFKELNLGSDVSSPSVRILEPAVRAGAPIWPNNLRIIGMFSGLAFLFGVMLAFLQEYLDKTIKLPEEVERKLGLPLLGSLMQLDAKTAGSQANAENYFVDYMKSPFAEAIRTIRTGVMLSGLDNPYKIIAITSTLPGEGKTTVSMNLACALGQLEKVLLIDADMRRAAMGPHFGLPKNAKGLADVAAGLESFDNCVHHFEKGNIHILPAGTIPPNPQELLSSIKFKTLLDEVSTRYDRIIIDTAPAHLVSDPKLVGRWASAFIYIVRAESTLWHMAAKEINELKKVNKPIIGAVLNGLSHTRLQTIYGRYRRKGYGGYGYGSYSYGGYGYGNEADDAPATSPAKTA